MGARYSSDFCAYDTLFTQSVSHIHEKIFFSLDYESFKRCLEVSKTWNELLRSESFQKKTKCVFREEIVREAIYLFEASVEGNTQKVRRHLSGGMVNLDLEHGYHQSTFLTVAADGGHIGVVQLLLNRGADPDKTNALGITPLSNASWRGHKVSIKVCAQLRDSRTSYIASVTISASANNFLS